jgi:ElaB/YqjD/DUF883 family membrane-anchored ribosome-binding protein
VSDPKEPESSASPIAQTVSGAVDKVSSVAGHAADTAQDLARQVRRQAKPVVESAYGQGGDLIEVIEDAIRSKPISSVLVAAAIGVRNRAPFASSPVIPLPQAGA